MTSLRQNQFINFYQKNLIGLKKKEERNYQKTY